MTERITLRQLNTLIGDNIRQTMPDNYWVIAEISEMRLNRNGHCYLELIEKVDDKEQVLAKQRAIIWAYKYRMISPYFETATGQELAEGIKVLINVSVEFHELYGMSLLVHDIEPSFTIGEMARKKMEIIKQLEEEGVLDMNKGLPVPIVFQRIAVISSPTAAGYGDFMNQLENNIDGFHFECRLFAATMQGEKTESAIVEALEHIYAEEEAFDCVVIIRGGGAQSELNAFNAYWLAYHISQFPLPVFTGIGHERDETVPDLVAHHAFKTPTAVAEFLIDQMEDFDARLNQHKEMMVGFVNEYLHEQEKRWGELSAGFRFAFRQRLQEEMHRATSVNARFASAVDYMIRDHRKIIDQKSDMVSRVTAVSFNRQKERLHSKTNSLKHSIALFQKTHHSKHEMIQQTVRFLDPENILRRGFSYTTCRGKVVYKADELSEGDEVTTYLWKGHIDAVVHKKGKEK